MDNLTDKQNSQSTLNDPLKILKTRYVKGEITKEKYEDMKILCRINFLLSLNYLF